MLYFFFDDDDGDDDLSSIAFTGSSLPCYLMCCVLHRM